jgi:hypothetical protein
MEKEYQCNLPQGMSKLERLYLYWIFNRPQRGKNILKAVEDPIQLTPSNAV